MRILTIPERLQPGTTRGEIASNRLTCLHSAPLADGRVVTRRAGKGLASEMPPGGKRRHITACREFVRHDVVIGRIHDDGDIVMVLCCRADHGRPAHVDVLDRVFPACTASNRRFEGIKIDDEKADGRDAMRGHCHSVLGVVTYPEETAMDGRMQSLHPSVHDFREPGDVRDLDHRKACLGEALRRTASRDQLDPQ